MAYKKIKVRQVGRKMAKSVAQRKDMDPLVIRRPSSRILVVPGNISFSFGLSCFPYTLLTLGIVVETGLAMRRGSHTATTLVLGQGLAPSPPISFQSSNPTHQLKMSSLQDQKIKLARRLQSLLQSWNDLESNWVQVELTMANLAEQKAALRHSSEFKELCTRSLGGERGTSIVPLLSYKIDLFEHKTKAIHLNIMYLRILL